MGRSVKERNCEAARTIMQTSTDVNPFSFSDSARERARDILNLMFTRFLRRDILPLSPRKIVTSVSACIRMI
jgi:hypothetical protein